jgi:chemotaxis response regulator CheB
LAAGFNNSAVLNNLDGIENALCQGFNGVNTAILQSGYNTQAGINGLSHQLADCCCATQRAIDGVKYENATNTCAIQNTINSTTRDIIENANANSRAILDFLTNDKIATLTAENQSLKFAASQSAQNAYIGATVDAAVAELIRRTGNDCPQPAFVVQPPQPVTFATNCCGQTNYAGNGCGCGSF